MASLIRRRSSRAAGAVAVADGKSTAAFCKKHPKHRQSPGVCSLCLNEKLSQFIAKASSSSASRKTRLSVSLSSSSLSSYDYSSSVSSCPSPLDPRFRFTTVGEAKGFSWLTKSRTVACVPRNMGKRSDYGDDEQKRRDRGGWLSSLIGPRRNNKRL